MHTLLDVSQALTNDLPRHLFKKPDWLSIGWLLVRAADTGHPRDIDIATDALVQAMDNEGWMSAARIFQAAAE